jgi:protein-L-isoaspartate O-methyltransferase
VPAPPPAGAGSPEDLVRVLHAEGIRDRRVLAAFRAVPRAGFVPLDAAGQAEVVSVDRFADLAAQARSNLAAAGLGRVRVVVGDGTLGVPDHDPYQAIVVSAASPHVPGPLIDQLAPGSRLVHPVGPGGHEQVTAFHKKADRLVDDARLIPARFVPLVGAHGTPSPQARDGR